jgi:GTP-sensing pleiotropic transcriptional regulator CodY
MFPEEQREKFQDEMIDKLSPPDSEAETVGSLLYISDLIAERQKKYFPDLKRLIVEYELTVSDGDITLNISSAPIESNR